MDENMRVAGDRLGDLDHLRLAHGKLGDPHARIDMDPKFIEDAACLAVGLAVADEQAGLGLAIEKDVLCHGQGGIRLNSWKFMAMPAAWPHWRRSVRRLAVDGDGAAILLVDAARIFISVDLPAPFPPIRHEPRRGAA